MKYPLQPRLCVQAWRKENAEIFVKMCKTPGVSVVYYLEWKHEGSKHQQREESMFSLQTVNKRNVRQG